MTLSHLVQRAPTSGLTPTARLLARPSPANQLQLSKAISSSCRSLSIGARRSHLRIAHHARVTDAACVSLQDNSRSLPLPRANEPDFRRLPSVDTGRSAAPRLRSTPRQAPSPVNPTPKSFRRSHSNALLRLHHTLPATASRAFSSSAVPAMAATKIDGTAIAKKVREDIKAEIAQKKEINPRFQPCLKIIQGVLHPERGSTCLMLVTNHQPCAVGDRSDSCKMPPSFHYPAIILRQNAGH